jgi:hypothetical protein
MSRLLLIACSAQKRTGEAKLPAVERYDGPAFRVLRKYLRESPEGSLTVLILSAKFGLIPSARKIPDYDLRMTRVGAERLREGVLDRLRSRLRATTYLEIGLCLGREYQSALAGYEDIVPDGTKVTTIRGGLGSRLTKLREWLRTPQPLPATVN